MDGYLLGLRTGSSPHTRGALFRQSVDEFNRGIIPAYAGSTAYGRTRSERRGDHPRIRGEHSLLGLPFNSSLGSSPHTRGALGAARRASKVTGIIPAYAGSTMPDAGSLSSMGDHPRIRGEHSIRESPIMIKNGIIPAYAGSTFALQLFTVIYRDHPRIRGEHPYCIK